MRTLIFGSNGQLGRDLVKVFDKAGEVCGYDLPDADICSLRQVMELTQAFEPSLVVNAAAYTNVEAAEDDEASAFATNEEGARNIAEAAAEFEVPVVYYSTDYVFGGTQQRPYEPDDPIAPIGVYARSKAAGEQAVRDANARHFILRTAWLYGPGGNNFIEKILRAAATRPQLRVVDDEWGSPTYTADLAEATRDICRTEAYGTYHVTNAGACSRYELAGKALALAGIAVPVEPCKSAEFPTKATRPLYSVLSNARFEAAVGRTVRAWDEALSDYMKRRQEES